MEKNQSNSTLPDSGDLATTRVDVTPVYYFPTQDPKYEICVTTINGQLTAYLVNAASHVRIPDDEPMMMFRGKDTRALFMIYDYGERCANEEHVEAVYERANKFQQFAKDHPERMKEPDTAKKPI